MSNHSAERPNGFLTTEVFKSFFAISGTNGNLVWNPGKERIPDNWYRRPSSNPYDAARAGVSSFPLSDTKHSNQLCRLTSPYLPRDTPA